MYDSELVLEILRQIYQAAQTILKRFQPVKTVSDFVDSPAGMEKLDSLCMLLIAIGEALKIWTKPQTSPCCGASHRLTGKKPKACGILNARLLLR